MKAAKAAGAMISFDLNLPREALEYRRRPESAVSVIARIVENVDVLVGNEEDLQMGLGIPGPEVHAKSKLDPSAFFGMIDNVTKKHPNVKSWRPRCAKSIPRIVTAGAQWPGSTARRTPRRLRNST